MEPQHPQAQKLDSINRETDAPGGPFAQLALWTAANLAGVMTALLVTREPFFRRLMGKLGKGKQHRPRTKRPSSRQSLAMLADAVLGSTRHTIASVFGPPRSAVLNGPPPPGGAISYWQAGTWYYPLPNDGPMAMAIQFDGQHAQKVEFFQPPR